MTKLRGTPTRRLCIVMAAAAALALAACSSGSSTGSTGSTGSTTTARGTRTVNVGFTIHPKGSKLSIAFVNSGEANAYGAEMKAVAVAWAAKNHVSLTDMDSNFSPDTELDLIQNAISSGKYNAISTLPLDPHLLCTILTKTAPDDGIMVSSLNSPVCDADTEAGDIDAGWTPGLLNVSYPGAAKQALISLAQKCAQLAPGPQQVTMITGPAYLSDTADAMTAFKAIPNFTINQQLISQNIDTADGLSLTQTALLSHPKTSLIYTLYGSVSAGVVTALQDAGKTAGKVKVCGVAGGTTADITDLREGWITAEAVNDPKKFVIASLQSILNAWNGIASPRVVDLGAAGQVVPYTQPEILTQATASQIAPY